MQGLRFTPLRERGITVVARPAGTPGQEALNKSAQNLLLHIPGEASGFYLMAVGAIAQPTPVMLTWLFFFALVLLVLVRWVAKASRAMMITTILAFVIWMFVLDNGLFKVLFPNLLPGAFGLIVAVFYSTVVTILANAGTLK